MQARSWRMSQRSQPWKLGDTVELFLQSGMGTARTYLNLMTPEMVTAARENDGNKLMELENEKQRS